ncbi:phosphoribosyltransferase family protein [Agriterribacter humi]|jgi:pyrimidine operon attenuation protein/uracil phosphoribosyltransferase|uniref:phosphoribosyltransferase family protein n=1 Tax=Agriterribacter humi TaxID=1104781 RepID=UPI001265734A|nr:phosphoribosyltransferase family protein [Agriterribacter humi]
MKNYILTKEKIDKILRRMAFEIVERNTGEDQILLAGIRENGVVIAQKLKQLLSDTFKGKIEVMDIAVDDKRRPGKITVSSGKNFDDAVVIVVDDVANSGKTMLYALKPFLQDQPKKIQTLALVDRTHKTFPVHTDYVGYAVATTLQEHIFVEVENENITGAWLE